MKYDLAAVAALAAATQQRKLKIDLVQVTDDVICDNLSKT